MNKNILVTGGAGYIGSHACKLLAQQGYRPISYDNLVYGHEWAVNWGPLEQGDLLDRARLDQVMSHYQPLAVMHFAAYAYVGESVEDPAKYYRNNVVGSLNLLEAMRDHQVDKLIFSSTCATYGIPQQIPIGEDHPQHPINPYGTTKLIMEQMMEDFSVAHSLRYVALRYFNAAGADPDGQIGEDHQPEPHLIPLILQTALGKRERIAIYGNDYETPDGTCIRDYIHVSDLAQAHGLALEYLCSGGHSQVFNLGNGKGFSVQQVVDAAKAVTGRPIPTQAAPRRAGDPARLVGDSSKIITTLGWKPEFAELETILRTAWNWHLHHVPKNET